MSGRRHAARPVRHRGRAVLAGSVALFVVAICAGTVAYALQARHRPSGSKASGGAGAVNSPMNSVHGAERDIVPDACETLSANIADRLAPGADRSAMSHAAQSDEHTECAWTLFGSARSRQLTVELRALTAEGGTSGIDAATRTFQGEWQSDRAGKDLADTATVKDSRGVTGVGEQAYVVYTVDANDDIGEAVANARLANVLITVHYSGGDDRDRAGRPLPANAATDGALSAARDVIAKLESHA